MEYAVPMLKDVVQTVILVTPKTEDVLRNTSQLESLSFFVPMEAIVQPVKVAVLFLAELTHRMVVVHTKLVFAA